MKKNKKMKLMLSTLTTLTVATPIAVISCGQHKDSATIEKTTRHATPAAPAEAATPATGETQAHFKPTDNLIEPKVGLDFKRMESFEGEIDMSVWRAEPIAKKYDDAFMEQWAKNARVEGWRSVEDYQMYLQYKIETNGHSGYDKFGGNSTPDANWLSWNWAPGQKLNETYDAGRDSSIRPTWVNAENQPWNDIDNTLHWYQYDTGAEQFVFDENNIDNAWKRLINMQRLIPTTSGEIIAESSSTTGADGVNPISDSNPAVTRNKYMVDGQLVDHLPRGLHNYFFVTNDRSKYIRDDNGWKVVVTDRNKEEALSGIINPADKANTGEVDGSGNYRNQTLRIYDKNPLHYKGDINQIKIKSIEYGVGYNKNPDHDITKLYDENGMPQNLSDPETYWSGKYSVTLKENSFSDLVNFKYSFFPQEQQPSTQATYRDRFGQLATQAFTHPWAGGGYAFQWVEDGHGGHKVYKALDALRKIVPEWRKDNETTIRQHGDTDPVSTFKIFANWHHVFPVRDWFVGEADIYKDTGL